MILVMVLLATTLRADDLRAISDAERAAVQDVAAFLSRGPVALQSELGSASPLRMLPLPEALTEIEARTGPATGAAWTLQTVVPALKDKTAVFMVNYPSGIDETVMMDMSRDGNAWRIADIRVLAQRSRTAPIFAKQPAVVAPVTGDAESGEERVMILIAGLLAAAIAASASLVSGGHGIFSRALLGVSVAALGVAAALAVQRDDRFRFVPPPARVKPAASPLVERFSALLPLRRAMAAGAADVEPIFRSTPAVGSARQVADLWKAQWDLQQTRSAAVVKTLSRFPSPSEIPLAEILRARLAYFEGKEVDSIVAYEHAVSLGPGRDGLWYETEQSLSTLGYDERARRYLNRLARMGSRDANVYYSLAVLDAADRHEEDCERELKKAFELKPVERASLVGTAALWSVLRRPAIAAFVKLSDPSEATFASPTLATRTIALPPEATARVSGDFFDVRIGEQELAVPGGASLAPAGAAITDAGEWGRSDEQKALADLPRLLSVPRTAGSFTQPQLRLRITRAVRALAEHNSWPQLLQLTEGLSPRWENIPPQILFLRDVALQRMQRRDEARLLLEELAASPVVRRKNEPETMIELAEMLASIDQYDPAIKLLDRAASVRQISWIDDRVRQLQMNRRLQTKYATLRTTHFEIHYPDDVKPAFVQDFGAILESEFTRVQKTVPVPGFRSVVVDLLWWRDFRSTYTGSDFILGFYEGKITVPLAGAPAWVPPIVAILTHEMTHAMIAQATNDQAPHWFQEGLAQRMEMRQFHANAFNMYEDDKLLSIALLDAVLQGSPDPGMIQEAYIESQTVIRFIEATYGPSGIPKMLEAFHDGATTAEAFQRLSGLTTAAFDTQLRTWGRGKATVFENPPPVRYDSDPNNSLHWVKPKQKSVSGPAGRSHG
jgi:tetratricopeptide (TPR) repeat protein